MVTEIERKLLIEKTEAKITELKQAISEANYQMKILEKHPTQNGETLENLSDCKKLTQEKLNRVNETLLKLKNSNKINFNCVAIKQTDRKMINVPFLDGSWIKICDDNLFLKKENCDIVSVSLPYIWEIYDRVYAKKKAQEERKLTQQAINKPIMLT